MSSEPSTTCTGCGLPIIWVHMEAGRDIPVNASPDPNGTIVVWCDRDRGGHYGRYATADTKIEVYRSHYATCPRGRQVVLNG